MNVTVPAEPRASFSVVASLGPALAMVRAERENAESAWVLAVAQGVETAAGGTGAGTLTCRRTVTPGCDETRKRSPAVSTSLEPCGGQMGELLARYFPEALDWATRVAKRESGCNPRAVNNEGCDTSGRTSSHALGTFQMCYPLHVSIFNAVGCSDPLDAECGVKAARRLYDGAGRAPWGG